MNRIRPPETGHPSSYLHGEHPDKYVATKPMQGMGAVMTSQAEEDEIAAFIDAVFIKAGLDEPERRDATLAAPPTPSSANASAAAPINHEAASRCSTDVTCPLAKGSPSNEPMPTARSAVGAVASAILITAPDEEASAKPSEPPRTPTPSHQSNEDLLENLSALCLQTDARGELVCYSAIARDYLALSRQLNELGVTPPRLRPRRNLPTTSDKHLYAAKAAYAQLSIDSQAIDLHWLYCNGKRDRIPERGMEHLFSGPEFNWDVAKQLASKEWKAETKVSRSLALSDFEQFQLAKLQTNAIGQRWRNTLRDKPLIEAGLKNRARRYPSLEADIPELTALWQADRLCGATATLRDKARMHMWLSGRAEPWPPQLARDRLRKLRGHIEAARKGP